MAPQVTHRVSPGLMDPTREHNMLADVQTSTALTDGISVDALISHDLLDRAFDWLYQRRKDWPSGADVWRFRRNWPHEKARLREELLAGTYQVGLLDRVTLCQEGELEAIDLWTARDAVVMKTLAWLLEEYLPLSPCCMHLKGHGGQKSAVRQVLETLPQHQFVLKTDVKSYYASIDHLLLLDQLADYILDREVLNIIAQYLKRCAEWGGLFWEHKQGSSLSCPLSPIIGTFFLAGLDIQLEQLDVFYVRYMDDILVLAPTRWKLRTAVKVVNQVLSSLKLEKHPDKTYIGRVDNGFDWLGYHIRPSGLSVAQKTLENFVARARRLYEQEPREGSFSRLGEYVRR